MLKERFRTYLQVEKGYSAHTIKAYLSDLEAFEKHLDQQTEFSIISEETIGSIHRTHCRSWLASLTERQLLPRSINRKLSSLHTFFNYCIREGLLVSNPFKQLPKPKNPRILPKYLKETEIALLFKEVEFPDGFEGERDRCILEMLYGCGLRRSELIELRLRQLDLAQQLIRITGKGNKQRIIPFGDHLLASLEVYISLRNQQLERKHSMYLFTRTKGEKLYPKLVYRITQKYLGMISNIGQKSPHVLRHSYATHLLDRGADLNAIKELLGHQSLAATQLYTHNSISKLKDIHHSAHPKENNKTN